MENEMKLRMKVLQEPILSNKNGVSINARLCGHYSTLDAECWCGEPLLVAAAVFGADHKKDDPVMACLDQGVHSIRFKDLVKGRQPNN